MYVYIIMIALPVIIFDSFFLWSTIFSFPSFLRMEWIQNSAFPPLVPVRCRSLRCILIFWLYRWLLIPQNKTKSSTENIQYLYGYFLWSDHPENIICMHTWLCWCLLTFWLCQSLLCTLLMTLACILDSADVYWYLIVSVIALYLAKNFITLWFSGVAIYLHCSRTMTGGRGRRRWLQPGGWTHPLPGGCSLDYDMDMKAFVLVPNITY